MTSPTSGIISPKPNFTRRDPPFFQRNFTVPPAHVVMITFEENSKFIASVRVIAYSADGQKSTPWSRGYGNSDFAHLFPASIFTVRYSRRVCKRELCFRLFFSFFPAASSPRKLASGLWNCSVDNYPSFHLHLACNLQVECEDGRDETEHCAFSSADCQGLVALCNRCYKFVESLRGFESEAREVNQRGNEYCKSLGGRLAIPKCVEDWCQELKRTTTVHRFRLAPMWIGVYTRDLAVPNMYRYSMTGQDGSVFHHTLYRAILYSLNEKVCFRSDIYGTFSFTCQLKPSFLSDGVICEVRISKDQGQQNQSLRISLTTAGPRPDMDTRSLTTCTDGHRTRAFLPCGSYQHNPCGYDQRLTCTFPSLQSSTEQAAGAQALPAPVPTFTCDGDVTTLSYTLLCDFITDCQDSSDELFCKHPACVKEFTCASGQCIPYDVVCDFISQCHDQSDETTCEEFKVYPTPEFYFPSPVLIRFDGSRFFIVTRMNSSDSCPDTHYRCPGVFNDCLPVYTLCNGLYDCLENHDEEGCEEARCAGLFKCRASMTCVHSDHLCDGWPHCPMQDDELACHVSCPAGCVCQGLSFRCSHPVSLATVSQIRYLDAKGSKLTISDIKKNIYLIHLILANSFLTGVPEVTLLNLRYLDLSGNRIQQVNVSSFLGLESLQHLYLSHNPVTALCSSSSPEDRQTKLSMIDLSYTPLTVLDPTVLAQFSGLQILNLTFTAVHTISADGFQSTPQLKELYLEGSPIRTFPATIFKDIFHLRVITSQNYKLCCSNILPYHFDDAFCYAPTDEISSCKDLLHSELYRGFLWLISCLSMTGNVVCFLVRLCARKMTSSKSGYSVFVTNLSTADFLMGVYIAIIGVADQRFRGSYLHYDDAWKSSAACKVAGFLSLLSSEVSALIIWLITLDRFVVLRFPFSTLRFQKPSATLACLLIWLVGCSLALLPLLPLTAHWEFYSQTGICIPLPVTRQEFKGRVYSFSVLIILNFLLFLFISTGQAFVYWSIQKNALKTNTSKITRDITIARRLITVALTDFLCWFPIGLCGILALAGIPIPGEVNVALAIFVLPLNAAINPFMYTFNVLVEKRRKASEKKLLKWLECNAALISE